MFHSLVEKENRKISDGEQRSNLKIDSNKIHGKRTRWFLVDFSISHGLVIVRVNCVENCILLSIGWISRSRNSHCPILFSARNFRQLPRTFFPSFTFGFRWWSFCRHFVGGFSSEYKGRENWSYLISIVRPGGPFQHAPLLVEREELDVDVAAAAKYPMAQPHHFPRVTHYHVRVYDRRAVLWIGATNKTDHGRNESRLCWQSISKFLSWWYASENISSYLSFLLSFSFDVSVFVDHCNFFFLSTESSLTCCTESYPASRRDCKEHESLGSPRTPRRSISGDGPSKSVSPSNWSSVSDSSRPANEKSPRFIEKNPLASAEKNISGWWKNDSRRVYARQICESYHRGVLLPSCHLS